MSSSQSILTTNKVLGQPYDFKMIANALEYKQGKYDANADKIQQTIDTLAGLQLIKGEDQDYLSQRIDGLVDKINSAGALNLSQNGLTRQLNSQIGQVVDKNVKEAYKSSLNYRDYFAQIEQAKKDGTYNKNNDAYSRQQINRWEKDGQAGTALGRQQYTPYHDYRAEMTEALETMYKNSEQKITSQTEGGYLRTQKFKGLTKEELSHTFNRLLSPEAANQLAIDGWATLQNNPTELVAEYDRYADKRISTAKQKQIDATDDATRSYWSEQEALYTSNKQLSPEQKAQNFVATSLTDGLAQQFKQRIIDDELKADTTWQKKQQLIQDRYEFDLEQQPTTSSNPAQPVVGASIVPSSIDDFGSGANATHSTNTIINDRREELDKVVTSGAAKLTGDARDNYNEKVEFLKNEKNYSDREAKRVALKNTYENFKVVSPEKDAFEKLNPDYQSAINIRGKALENSSSNFMGGIDENVVLALEDNSNSKIRKRYNNHLAQYGFQIVSEQFRNKIKSDGGSTDNMFLVSELSSENLQLVRELAYVDMITTYERENTGASTGIGRETMLAVARTLAEMRGEDASLVKITTGNLNIPNTPSGRVNDTVEFLAEPVKESLRQAGVSRRVELPKGTRDLVDNTNLSAKQRLFPISRDNSITQDGNVRKSLNYDNRVTNLNELLEEDIIRLGGFSVLDIDIPHTNKEIRENPSAVALINLLGSARNSSTVSIDKDSKNKIKKESNFFNYELGEKLKIAPPVGNDGLWRLLYKDATIGIPAHEVRLAFDAVNAPVNPVDLPQVNGGNILREQNVPLLKRVDVDTDANISKEYQSSIINKYRTNTPNNVELRSSLTKEQISYKLSSKYDISDNTKSAVEGILGSNDLSIELTNVAGVDYMSLLLGKEQIGQMPINDPSKTPTHRQWLSDAPSFTLSIMLENALIQRRDNRESWLDKFIQE